ncbi:MAG TPA: isoprenylcysteine carboxylmethyltransferase family protein [Beijerinckiaceae bacterium]
MAGVKPLTTEQTAPPAFTQADMQKFQNRRRLTLAVLAVLLAPAIALTAPLFEPTSGVGLLIHAASLACLAMAVLVRTWSAIYVGGRKQRELVTGGPYALTRNPLYVGTLFGALGAGLSFGSITLGAALCVATFLVFDWVVRLEEKRLRDEFGLPFDAYMARTPRWLPKSWRVEDASRLEVNTRVVVRTCAQALLFFAAPMIAALLAAARDAGWVATLLRLP